MNSYRSFQLSLLLPNFSDQLFVNPTIVLRGELEPGYPQANEVVLPGRMRAVWLCQADQYNEPVHFIAVLTSPRTTVPIEIHCGVPVFGKAWYTIRHLPDSLITNDPELWAPTHTSASLNLVLSGNPDLLPNQAME